MRIFIASPLFNESQHEIIGSLETLLTSLGYDYYSARQHSGSDRLTPEQKKTFDAWTPVYESNVHGLDSCDAMIAVLEYALPKNQGLMLVNGLDEYPEERTFTDLSLPDAGTVWEIGYHIAQGKPVIGYYSFPEQNASHLNLMLSHGVHALTFGPENLKKFLEPADVLNAPTRAQVRALRELSKECSTWFLSRDWSSAKNWDADRAEVE